MPDAGGGIAMPPYAYVPGKTARHPEDWFDGIKASVPAGAAPCDLAETQAFRAGLAYLDAGFYWECHEVLEAVWMQTPQGSPEREMVQALIQLANAHLKVLMARPRAALRLCDMVEAHVQRIGTAEVILGVDIATVRAGIAKVRLNLRGG
ncbi:MAG: DUF309 domain-containing protein [Sulfitobacter sp.]|nr:DUF309 domain-containing protein [Sulfitobacter sp.]